ncbi:MAG: AraC family transcriptional regulator [Flavobacteriaceae bacterium]|nr:AraC family transcriptional regulator [Flavobacteriaceae bacterium]
MSNQKENIIRINRVKEHIEKNVEKELPLAELASIANFSPFHFQRIFKSIVKETPKQYIKRLRLEATAHDIVAKSETSLFEVAIQYGFNSLEAFSRAFKNYYGLSPDRFRKKNDKEKIAILQSKMDSIGQNKINQTSFLSSEIDTELEGLEVKVIKLPPKKLIYISVTLKDIDTVIDGYKRIKQWASARDLINSNTEVFALMRDYPAFTALDKCRFLTCISVKSKPDISGEINYQEIPSRTYATYRINGGIDELVKSVTKFVMQWLPESGFEINHVPAIIIPLDDPITNHPHDISYQFYIALSPK